jgi:hypothetical protein
MTLQDRTIIAIDPGTTESAYVLTDGRTLHDFGKRDNNFVREWIRGAMFPIYVEMIASYGMPVGREIFETCLWIGRFWETSGQTPTLIYRKDVKLALCGSLKANDATIRQALVDRFGPGKDRAIGTKKSPGPLYGVTGDVWAALAVAVTALERPER